MEMFKLFVKEFIRLLLHVFYVFPIKNNVIVFESYGGRRVGCNPLFIYDYLRQTVRADVKLIWAVRSPDLLDDKNIKYVSFFSWSYFKAVLTAKVYVTNIGGYNYIPFRKNQIVINTWHAGGAYKKIEKDFYHFGKSQWLYERSLVNLVSSTSYFLSSSAATTDCLSSAWTLPKKKFVRSGLPRNDIFFHASDMRKRSESVRHQLGIGQPDFVVLYAPTFRNTTKNPDYEYALIKKSLFDAIKKRFGPQNVRLLFRLHISLLHKRPDLVQKHECVSDIIDVSTYPEMQDILCAADMLITDYSSSVWDYSFTYRPCFLFTTDLEGYKRKTDFYTPIEEWGFPICKTNEELRERIEAFDENEFKQAMIHHHEKLGSYERGTATKEVSQLILSHINK